MFTTKFDSFACDRDKITCDVDGFTLTATIYNDDGSSAPWEREDGHGSVTPWVSRDKQAGERILNSDRGSRRFYDFAGAVKTALKDRWGVTGGRLEGETERAYAARAAEQDFAMLKAWCDDEWHYVGVAVTVEKAGVGLTGRYDHALWGIECNYPGSDNAYLSEVANEYVDEALAAARAKLAELCR